MLIDSFFDFYIDTLMLAAQGALYGQLPKDDQTYAIIYLSYFTTFRNLRAAETLKNHGYPLDGFALLRDLKDRSIYLGAVVGGLVSIHELHGYNSTEEQPEKWTDEYRERMRNRQKKVQSGAMKKMVGAQSGLDAGDIDELEKWRDMFHEEVHGSLFTYIEDLRVLFREKRLPSFAPEPHRENFDISMFINRAIEIGWMLLRSMPFLQLEARAFGKEWVEKWQLLDAAFRLQEEGLGELGKPIAYSFIRLMDAKFAFTPDTAYVERSI